MKFILFLAICSTSFLPTPVEGTLFFLYSILSSIGWPARRDERDCNTLKELAGLTNTEACICVGLERFGVYISCDPMKQQICMTSSDTSFCTNETVNDTLEITPTSTSYVAQSNSRRRLSFLSPEVTIVSEEIFGTFMEEPEFRSSFKFFLERGDGASSSNKYSVCSVESSYVIAGEDTVFDDCNSCDICESGIDIKYDCSNVNATYSFSNVTNTTEFGPGPKVESCIPIANLLPLF